MSIELQKEIENLKQIIAQREIDVEFRTKLIAEKDQFINDIIHEKDDIINQKDCIISERDKRIQELEHQTFLDRLAIEAAPYEYGGDHPKVLASEMLLQRIIDEKSSLSRFGDGEFELMDEKGRPWFQTPNEELAKKLRECFDSNLKNHIIAVADILGDLRAYKQADQANIRYYLKNGTRQRLIDRLGLTRTYYDAYVSRPYLMYEDKEHGTRIFDLFKKLWENQDVLLVEGEFMRSGVGNDLFSTAKSVRRIICPSKNAFDYYQEILFTIKENAKKEDLILIGLGPTATVLAYDLAKESYWALDLGQLDMEYEWCKMRAEERIPIPGKAVPEIDSAHSVPESQDSEYFNQIIARIDEKLDEGIPSISVIVPVCNVEQFVEQCVRSIMNQTFEDLEIICINDGSTDGSLEILRKLEKEDSRIIVIDKENTGYGDTINLGLKRAKGMYIGVVESDDFAELDMYEKLYGAAEKFQADVAKGNFYEYYIKTGEKNFVEYLETMEYNSLVGHCYDVLLLGPTIWAGVYRREFLLENNIWLLPTAGASYQDTAFAFKVMYSAKRITFIKDAVLNYRCDNTMSSVNSSGKIYCIKEEMDEAKRYLLRHYNGEKDLAFFVRLKFLRYKWNLDRLQGEAKTVWYKLMKEEFDQDDKSNLLKKTYWPQEDWIFVQKMISE